MRRLREYASASSCSAASGTSFWYARMDPASGGRRRLAIVHFTCRRRAFPAERLNTQPVEEMVDRIAAEQPLPRLLGGGEWLVLGREKSRGRQLYAPATSAIA
jgi:hypothetical protein